MVPVADDDLGLTSVVLEVSFASTGPESLRSDVEAVTEVAVDVGSVTTTAGTTSGCPEPRTHPSRSAARSPETAGMNR